MMTREDLAAYSGQSDEQQSSKPLLSPRRYFLDAPKEQPGTCFVKDEDYKKLERENERLYQENLELASDLDKSLANHSADISALEPSSAHDYAAALREIANGPPGALPNDEVAAWAGQIASDALSMPPPPRASQPPTDHNEGPIGRDGLVQIPDGVLPPFYQTWKCSQCGLTPEAVALNGPCSCGRGTLTKREHHELCDVNDRNAEGIVKPCNCKGRADETTAHTCQHGYKLADLADGTSICRGCCGHVWVGSADDPENVWCSKCGKAKGDL